MTSRPTIRDVAARAGVSKSVVSRVLSGSTLVSPQSHEAVMVAAAELGYRPNAAARHLVQGRTFTVGVVVSDLHNPFFPDIVDGVEDVARERGLKVLVMNGNRDPHVEAAAVDALLELRVDGLVLASPQLSTPAMERAAASTPVAVVTRRVRSATLASITADDVRGAQLAVEHLVALGHRRIALVRGAGSAGARDRERGYERAMARAGLEPWVAAGAFTEEGGRAGAEALLAAAVPPTAICAPNDLAAIGALTAIETAGLRVPGDVSLTGYDNTTLAALRHIALTTIDQPRHELGRRAMERVLDRLEGRDGAAGHVELEPTLVVRETTAPPRAAGG